MHEARFGPDMLGDAREKGDDVVLDLALDLVDARDVEAPRVAQRLRGAGRNLPEPLHRFGGKRLDFQPDLIFAVIGPDGRHLRPGIAGDHEALIMLRQPPVRARCSNYAIAGGSAATRRANGLR